MPVSEKHGWPIILLAALVLAVAGPAGCARKGGPAPVVFKGSSDPTGRVAEIRRQRFGGSIEVRRGDTVYAIARRTDVSMRQIIDANGLRPPYMLRPGQKLVLPGPRIHTVTKGDTVYKVSRRYGVDMASLVRANGMGPPYTIRVGQVLRLPGGARQAAGPVQTRKPAGRGARRQATLPRRTARSTVPQPPPRRGSKFAWPVRGQIISAFGPKSGGLHNDGINIAAQAGSSVHAADNGVVAYSGNELRSFGNLLLIRHEGGWMTAYAHNQRLLVARGETVKQGQAIAQLGSSGSVRRPQLHFEIRRGTEAVDPSRYLETLKSRLFSPGLRPDHRPGPG